jgi:hypothetical protein
VSTLIDAEVALKTSKGYRFLHRQFPTDEDAEGWADSFLSKPNTLYAGCRSAASIVGGEPVEFYDRLSEFCHSVEGQSRCEEGWNG